MGFGATDIGDVPRRIPSRKAAIAVAIILIAIFILNYFLGAPPANHFIAP